MVKSIQYEVTNTRILWTEGFYTFIGRCKIARNAHNMIHAIVLRITLFHRDSTVLINILNNIHLYKNLQSKCVQVATLNFLLITTVRDSHLSEVRLGLSKKVKLGMLSKRGESGVFKILEFLDVVRLTNSSSKCWEFTMILEILFCSSQGIWTILFLLYMNLLCFLALRFFLYFSF